jgi:hypothetical protein
MQIDDEQLDKYIKLYKEMYCVELERERALLQFRKLIKLVIILSKPGISGDEIERLNI